MLTNQDQGSNENNHPFQFMAFPLEEPLQDVKQFDCDDEFLNNFIAKTMKKHVQDKLCSCRILVDVTQKNKLVGFYSLQNFSLAKEELNVTKGPKIIPVTKLSMLAIDKSLQGKGIGKKVLVKALKDAYDASQLVGSFGVYIDAIEDKIGFYQKLGFISIGELKAQGTVNTLPMFLPMQTLAEAFTKTTA
ncbi:GNAT family N-acetyltransferase [Aeromonas aquatilis]